MGLIRKSLMLSTGGVVRGSSKKQRVAKAGLKELQAQTRLAQGRPADAHQNNVLTLAEFRLQSAQAKLARARKKGLPEDDLADKVAERYERVLELKIKFGVSS